MNGAAGEGLTPVAAPEFDLRATLGCGQVFHWLLSGNGYAGTIGETAVYIEKRGDALLVTPGCEELARRYFALDHLLPEIYASFPDDPTMNAALAACRGLRIIRQPLWECLATFITSALKQVAHIAQISHLLRQRFGRRVGEIGGRELYAYPDAARVAALEEADLRACGLGFRARSLLETARTLAAGEGNQLADLRRLDRAAALAVLTGFRGVGTKVANCVLLFGYEHLDAFPIDVWIERVLRERYFPNEPEASMGRLQVFAQTHFGIYGGYAQQYLFHHARLIGRGRPPAEELAAPAPVRRVRRARPAVRGRS